MQKKNIKIKVCDLKPAKDAIGGRHRHKGHRHAGLLSEKDGPGVHAPGGDYGIHLIQ